MQASKNKIIVWGYPLYSHTHSYTHQAFYEAFKYLGYETYWFHDDDYPLDFDYSNCIFWTEGFADKNIPLNSSSTYFVHVCPSPKKYIESGVKKFIDVRTNSIWIKDHVYSYTMNKQELEKLGPCCYYERAKSGNVGVKNDYHDYEIADYDKIYISWASNKFPEEFNLDDVYFPRERVINFCGNLSDGGVCENYSTFSLFIKECEKEGISFNVNNPWNNPLTQDEVIRRTKQSILAADVRGPEHIKNGYVPCRVLKSISWGHLGMTNSSEVHKELEGNCIFESDPAKLFHLAMEKRTDYNYIRNSMLYVKENHTFLNRVNSIMKIV
jgi:hypothetical protein